MERQIGLVVGGRWSLDALGECLPNTRLPTLHWPNPPFTENEIRGVGGGRMSTTMTRPPISYSSSPGFCIFSLAIACPLLLASLGGMSPP